MTPVTVSFADIDRSVNAARAEMIQFLQTLVQSPSLADQEGPAQRVVADKLRSIGLSVDIVPTHFYELRNHPAFDDDCFSPDRRINVVGRWRGTQAGEGRSLILNGHIDVVPPGDESLWIDPPFSGALHGDQVYGRGACDMKGGLTAGIFALDILQRLGYRPARDILFESVIGEESGGVGTLTTIVKGYLADAAVLLEPTDLSICPVQAGALTFRLTVSGLAAHAAMKAKGVSAIEKFGLLFNEINQLEVERHRNYHHPLFDDPEHIAPISIGTIHGGKWHSTVPEEVVAEGRLGVLPGESNQSAREALAGAIARACARDPWLKQHPPELEWFEGQFESADMPLDHPLLQSLSQAHQQVTGEKPAFVGSTAGTDSRLFIRHGHIPSTLYGPGPVHMAHAVNEYLPVDELMTAVKVIARLIVNWCGGQPE